VIRFPALYIFGAVLLWLDKPAQTIYVHAFFNTEGGQSNKSRKGSEFAQVSHKPDCLVVVTLLDRRSEVVQFLSSSNFVIPNTNSKVATMMRLCNFNVNKILCQNAISRKYFNGVHPPALRTC
jgi:hypothetical protein